MKYLKTFNNLNEGKYDNNNLDEPNSKYEVIEPFSIWLLAGTEPSGTYYGSSRIYTPYYNEYKANPGDIIENLYGGVFYKGSASNNIRTPVLAVKPVVSHPLEKTKPQYNRFPLEKLKKI